MRFVVRHDGNEIPVEVERHGASYRVRIGDRWHIADMVDAGAPLRSLRLEDGAQQTLVHHRDGTTHTVTFADGTYTFDVTDPLSLKRAKREDEVGGGGAVRALMPGRIVRVLVNAGDAVRKGAGLLILEAMKMENEIQAPADGTVGEILVSAGQTVEAGAELVKIS